MEHVRIHLQGTCLHKAVPRNHGGICSRPLAICRILCSGIVLKSKQVSWIQVASCWQLAAAGSGRSAMPNIPDLNGAVRKEPAREVGSGMTFFPFTYHGHLEYCLCLCCRRHIPDVSWHPSTDLSLLQPLAAVPRLEDKERAGLDRRSCVSMPYLIRRCSPAIRNCLDIGY